LTLRKPKCHRCPEAFAQRISEILNFNLVDSENPLFGAEKSVAETHRMYTIDTVEKDKKKK